MQTLSFLSAAYRSFRSQFGLFLFLSFSPLMLLLPRAHAASAFHPSKKIFMVILENTDLEDAKKAKFFSQLISQGAHFDHFDGVSHPSEPNYLAMVAGTDFGLKDDSMVNYDAQNLTDLLEAHHRSWKLYAEDFPGECFQGARSGKYARKHVPLISFKSIQNDPKRCAQIVNARQFDKDLANQAVPDFSLYVPNMDNDGHDTGIDFADAWLARRIGPLLKNPKFMDNTLVIITFDESRDQAVNHIYPLLIGASVKPGSVFREPVNHYSILKLIEDNWALGDLGKGDKTARAITGIWR